MRERVESEAVMLSEPTAERRPTYICIYNMYYSNMVYACEILACAC